ncbi:hypothetical protein PMIN06_011624 [Paraphaeosphaeria minitans]|uniref:Uncharacterized protein n=1 Tax=Paraphaeosphaeria minitans TaxID=565426 RepID=A0A9P6KKT0_9PLEO|nr:hypothetical protein PMIN01_11844 [Paraphaeosphaeria minitans]
MADSVLIATLVLFIIGSLVSTIVAVRDCMALKNVKGGMKRRQWILVSVDAVQLGFFSFGIASYFQHHPDRVELGVTWALQCMACTNAQESTSDIRKVLLFVIYVGSVSMVQVGSSSLRKHKSSGGYDRSMRCLYWAIIFTNQVAIFIACGSIGVSITLLAHGEAKLRNRTITMLPCHASQMLYTCCFILPRVERRINPIPMGSEPWLELYERPLTAR